MLFDPRPVSDGLDTACASGYHSSSAATTRRRPSNDFLTLPSVSHAVPGKAILTWRNGTTEELTKFVVRQFETGRVLAEDVENPIDPGNAFAQAFFCWVRRQCAEFKRLEINFKLLDEAAVQDHIQYQYHRDEFEGGSPLYLGLELPEENVYSIGSRVDDLRGAHPLLLRTTLSLINRASIRTAFVQTPDEYLGMVAGWYWDGDPACTDEDALEELRDRFGADSDSESEDVQRYLPSNVRARLCPDDAIAYRYDPGSSRHRRLKRLGDVGLSSLSSHPNPMVSQLCHELLGIRRQLKRAAPRLWQPKRHGVRNMFGMGHSGNPVYFACSLVMSDDGLVGELLDSHYESEAGSGEATTYQSFVPIAAQASEIRKQFTDWKHAFQLLGSLDRVLALISA